ncbi:MAG: ABC-2 type transport system ATP-binding protein [Lentimonas sp.]|jgi:ABC-2 type transport system ATP-binding protein
MSNKIININNISKTYGGGFQALKNINLEINEGEIFALLGSNGAGKTTLISIICGLANLSSGEIKVGGHDIIKDYRAARSLIGLVPQELTTDMFETVYDTVVYTRGLFGKKKNPALIEKTLKDLSLWEKRNSKIVTLSGGMKRRVMIAKALSHEPKILFLDEPTAGVDVKLRKDMWNLVSNLRKSGVTIILTTHYIDEAEQMADRIGVIQAGEIILIEEKEVLMKKLGQKELHLELFEPIKEIPQDLSSSNLKLSADGQIIIFTYDATKKNNGIASLLEKMKQNGIIYQDLKTHQSSLEDIFIQLVK